MRGNLQLQAFLILLLMDAKSQFHASAAHLIGGRTVTVHCEEKNPVPHNHIFHFCL